MPRVYQPQRLCCRKNFQMSGWFVQLREMFSSRTATPLARDKKQDKEEGKMLVKKLSKKQKKKREWAYLECAARAQILSNTVGFVSTIDSEIKQLQDAVMANQDQPAQEFCLNTLRLARRIRYKICLVRRASMATLLAEDWPVNVGTIEEECTQASNCLTLLLGWMATSTISKAVACLSLVSRALVKIDEELGEPQNTSVVDQAGYPASPTISELYHLCMRALDILRTKDKDNRAWHYAQAHFKFWSHGIVRNAPVTLDMVFHAFPKTILMVQLRQSLLNHLLRLLMAAGELSEHAFYGESS